MKDQIPQTFGGVRSAIMPWFIAVAGAVLLALLLIDPLRAGSDQQLASPEPVYQVDPSDEIIAGYPVPQNTPPLPPQDVVARGGLDAILLDWEPSPSAGVTRYSVYRQVPDITEFQVITDTVGGLVFRDESVTANTDYTYYVTAIDAAGRESDPSVLARTTYEQEGTVQNQVAAGTLRLTIPDVRARSGERVEVPVIIENADGLCLGAYGIAIEYDAQVATPISVTNTALTFEYAFSPNTATQGRIQVASIGNCQANELVGPGALLQLVFDIAPNPDQTVSSLEFITGLDATVIYGQRGVGEPIPLELVSGQLTIGEEITYIRGDLNGDGVVSAPDAAIALQIANGVVDPTPEQELAGDVNSDNVVNAADAAILLYFAANQEWPPNDFEVATLAADDEQQVVQIAPGLFDARVGGEIDVPVQVRRGSVHGATGATIEMQYGDGLTLQDVRLDAAISSTYELDVDDTISGRIRVSMAGTTALPADTRNLAWVRFTVNDTGRANTSTTWAVVTGGSINDVAGRDFALSLLERELAGGAAGIPGDCNDDRDTDAGDLSAMVLRTFTVDNEFTNVSGCDANKDFQIDAGDISCSVLLIFNGPGACDPGNE